MEKNIKDYLHLYMGCEIKAVKKWRNYTEGSIYILNTAILNDFDVNERNGKIICKPLLRPLSDMTQDEASEMGLWANWHDVHFMGDDWEIPFFRPLQFIQLLSKHFDLFGLIESGLAIDRMKIDAMKTERTSE